MKNHNDRIDALFQDLKDLPDPAHSVHMLLDNKKIFLYGAGSGFITFSVFVLKKYGLKAYAVLDRKFKNGDCHMGITAFSPLHYAPTEEERKNAVVVITVGKREYHDEITECLQNKGFENIIMATDIYEYHLAHTPVSIEQQGFRFYKDNREKIQFCFEILSDQISRNVFVQFIETHIRRKPMLIDSMPLEEQYFPRDIIMRKGYSRFVNCGAYNGDTLKQLNSLHGKVDAIACFEPDLKNFALLSRYLTDNRHELANTIIAFPCGVFSRDEQLHFESGNETNSMITDRGDSFIQCLALDHALPCFRPTFIQMDIEGVEPEALQGAEQILRESRPDLAVCVYHAPNHIWDIPLYINSLNLGYEFYLRNHTSSVSETVLYATS